MAENTGSKDGISRDQDIPVDAIVCVALGDEVAVDEALKATNPVETKVLEAEALDKYQG